MEERERGSGGEREGEKELSGGLIDQQKQAGRVLERDRKSVV